MKLRGLISLLAIFCLFITPLISCKKAEKTSAPVTKAAPVAVPDTEANPETEATVDEEEEESEDEQAAEGDAAEEAGAIKTGGSVNEDPEVMYEQLPMNPDDAAEEASD